MVVDAAKRLRTWVTSVNHEVALLIFGIYSAALTILFGLHLYPHNLNICSSIFGLKFNEVEVRIGAKAAASHYHYTIAC